MFLYCLVPLKSSPRVRSEEVFIPCRESDFVFLSRLLLRSSCDRLALVLVVSTEASFLSLRDRDLSDRGLLSNPLFASYLVRLMSPFESYTEEALVICRVRRIEPWIAFMFRVFILSG